MGRLALVLDPAQLAGVLGVGADSVRAYLSGRRKPSGALAARIAEAARQVTGWRYSE